MEIYIRARLDPSSSNSLAITPLVVEHDGILQVTGLSSSSVSRGKNITTDVLENLITTGHARRADTYINVSNLTNLVALWIGNEFSHRAQEAGVKVPSIALKGVQSESEGMWGVTTAQAAWQHLDLWTHQAFYKYLRLPVGSDERRALAEIMRGALPLDARTLSACLKSAEDPERELAWQNRIISGPLKERVAEMKSLIDKDPFGSDF